jgi:hypothetical protein
MSYSVKTVCALVSIIGVAAIMGLSLRQPTTEDIDSRPSHQLTVLWNDAVMPDQELEDQLKLSLQRNYAKDAVADDVIDGRLTLFEAAARFRTINESNTQAVHWLTSYPYRNQPYELALCRSVIRRVEVELRSRGSGPEDDTVARLEAELAEHLKRHRRLPLPD